MLEFQKCETFGKGGGRKSPRCAEYIVEDLDYGTNIFLLAWNANFVISCNEALNVFWKFETKKHWNEATKNQESVELNSKKPTTQTQETKKPNNFETLKPKTKNPGNQ